jgi:hypothetical protein
MSPSRATPLLLAAALVACAGDRAPTEPPAREPADAPRTSAALASASTAAPFTRRFPFTRVSGDGQSVSTALALPGLWCVDNDQDTFRYELYPLSLKSLALSSAKSARVVWSTKQHYFHRGTTSVTEVVWLKLGGPYTGSIYSDGIETTYRDPRLIVETHLYGYTLSARELARLKRGEMLQVEGNLITQAKVPPFTCGLAIAGSQARSKISTPPYLELST